MHWASRWVVAAEAGGTGREGGGRGALAPSMASAESGSGRAAKGLPVVLAVSTGGLGDPEGDCTDDEKDVELGWRRDCLSIHFLTPKLETISVHTCSIKWSLLYLSRRAKGLHIELTAKSWHRRRPQFFSCPLWRATTPTSRILELFAEGVLSFVAASPL